LAKSAIAEAEPPAMAAMPAGHHAIFAQAQQAVELRAHRLLTQLKESENDTTYEAPTDAQDYHRVLVSPNGHPNPIGHIRGRLVPERVGAAALCDVCFWQILL
jgi:hypothetical protein